MTDSQKEGGWIAPGLQASSPFLADLSVSLLSLGPFLGAVDPGAHPRKAEAGCLAGLVKPALAWQEACGGARPGASLLRLRAELTHSHSLRRLHCSRLSPGAALAAWT